MEEIIGLLQANGYGYIATVDNGKPRVRPFGSLMIHDGRFYFNTDSSKDVYRQLLETPYIDYSSTSKDMVAVRLSGPISFCDDLSIKEMMLNKNPRLKIRYGSPDHPNMKVFYVEHGTAMILSTPPQTFEF